MARARNGLLSVFVVLVVALLGALACSSDGGTTGQSSGTSTPKATPFSPVEAASQNPLPPGAGPPDAALVPVDSGTTPKDASTTDSTVTDTGIDAPQDTGPG